MPRLVALLLLAAVAAAPRAAATGRFLWLSDIHFNPMADPSLVDRLNAAPARRWPVILNGAAGESLGRFGEDTDWRLLSSTLAAMKQALRDPDFILFTGDFLAHDFRRNFDATARDHSESAYRAFVLKSIEVLAIEFQITFPGTSVVPVLGNNDSYCGDYRITPGGAFLKNSLPVIRDLFGRARAPGFAPDWSAAGNYRLGLPRLPRVQIVGLDTVFFSPHYQDSCGASAIDDPARSTLAWLAHALAAAQKAHRRVWLVYHIPPGMDAYSSVRSGACPGRLVAMWKEADRIAFERLMRRYSGIVAANFAGHTHTDDMRLIDRAGFALITPAVSPIFGQNPAFRIVSYDASGSVQNMTTYDLPLQGGSAKWRIEYRFAQTWRVPKIGFRSLAALYRKLGADPRARGRWLDLYAVSRPPFWPKPPAQRAALRRAAFCAAGHLSAAGFAACYCPAGGVR